MDICTTYDWLLATLSNQILTFQSNLNKKHKSSMLHHSRSRACLPLTHCWNKHIINVPTRQIFGAKEKQAPSQLFFIFIFCFQSPWLCRAISSLSFKHRMQYQATMLSVLEQLLLKLIRAVIILNKGLERVFWWSRETNTGNPSFSC